MVSTCPISFGTAEGVGSTTVGETLASGVGLLAVVEDVGTGELVCVGCAEVGAVLAVIDVSDIGVGVVSILGFVVTQARNKIQINVVGKKIRFFFNTISFDRSE
jgi:hypothetical protein